MSGSAMRVYIFFRKEGFYHVECKDDESAKAQAELNPGTIRVERMHPSGKSTVIWRQQ